MSNTDIQIPNVTTEAQEAIRRLSRYRFGEESYPKIKRHEKAEVSPHFLEDLRLAADAAMTMLSILKARAVTDASVQRKPGVRQMAKPQTTPCMFSPWRGEKRDEWIRGRFHQWGSEHDEAGTSTIGIVEDEDGQIWANPPERIRFVTIAGERIDAHA